MANKINPKFYQTIDEQYVISLEDISLIRYVFVSNEWDSYYLLYMKGSANGIQLTYRDGLNIVNILSLSDDCKMYYDEYSATITENYCFPKKMYKNHRVTSLDEMQTGNHHYMNWNNTNNTYDNIDELNNEHDQKSNN